MGDGIDALIECHQNGVVPTLQDGNLRYSQHVLTARRVAVAPRNGFVGIVAAAVLMFVARVLVMVVVVVVVGLRLC